MSCVIDKLSLHLRKTNIKVVLLLSVLYRGAILYLRSVFSITTDYRGMTLFLTPDYFFSNFWKDSRTRRSKLNGRSRSKFELFFETKREGRGIRKLKNDAGALSIRER